MSRFLEYINDGCAKKKKKKKDMSEAAVKLLFAGYHLQDNILDDITVEELQTMIQSNVPSEKIDSKTATREFESLLKDKVRDARSIARKVIPELVKDFASMKEATMVPPGLSTKYTSYKGTSNVDEVADEMVRLIMGDKDSATSKLKKMLPLKQANFEPGEKYNKAFSQLRKDFSMAIKKALKSI